MHTVFVNGCFDLFHVGHLHLLEWASQFGRVVVGLNADESVHALKGDGHPIIPEYERAEILRGCRFVDKVVIFHEDTPALLVRNLRPDVLIVGPDHSTNSDECKVVEEYGGGEQPRDDT